MKRVIAITDGATARRRATAAVLTRDPATLAATISQTAHLALRIPQVPR